MYYFILANFNALKIRIILIIFLVDYIHIYQHQRRFDSILNAHHIIFTAVNPSSLNYQLPVCSSYTYSTCATVHTRIYTITTYGEVTMSKHGGNGSVEPIAFPSTESQ